MKTFWDLVRQVLLVTLVFALLSRSLRAEPCARIVSLAPSATEVACALGLCQNLVGVTQFCKYPDEVQVKPKVGGFLDPNYEAIMLLKPDLVVLLTDQVQNAEELAKINIKTIQFDHQRVNGIIDSLLRLGAVCGREAQAQQSINSVQARLKKIWARIGSKPTRRAMVAIGETMSSNSLYISGGDGFYSELLKLAGGENVYKGKTVSMPAISVEGLLALNPEVIIQINEPNSSNQNTAFERMSFLQAVKNKRVYVLNDYMASIPGPRFVDLVEKFAKFLHPELG